MHAHASVDMSIQPVCAGATTSMINHVHARLKHACGRGVQVYVCMMCDCRCDRLERGVLVAMRKETRSTEGLNGCLSSAHEQ